jgi:alkanesulfonate monooxygenase SsuD/methylene tetrahydromethanopterin reductase-like flavin-dependent oxidoreductase (luciferase family)
MLKKYFTGDTLDHVGKYWTFRDAPVTMKPYQPSRPPLWYAAASAESSVWPARQGANIICGGPVDKVRSISDRYRSESADAAAAADTPRAAGLAGVWRFVVVADTDAEAERVARQAWGRFHDSFYQLWRKHGTEPARLKLAPDFDGMTASRIGIAGSPKTVGAELIRQAQEGNLNYVVGQFMFGDMPHEDAMKSVGLFASEVMPAIRDASRAWL